MPESSILQKSNHKGEERKEGNKRTQGDLNLDPFLSRRVQTENNLLNKKEKGKKGGEKRELEKGNLILKLC